MQRIGLGHDTHRLEPGDGLWLGGIKLPHDKVAVGHSDADVLLHAVTDALLGAVGLGDIGELFPDTDPANRGRESAEMLTAAWEKVRAAGWQLESGLRHLCPAAQNPPTPGGHVAATGRPPRL